MQATVSTNSFYNVKQLHNTFQYFIRIDSFLTRIFYYRTFSCQFYKSFLTLNAKNDGVFYQEIPFC